MKIVFYSDSPIFGGHEVMAVKFIKRLACQHSITVIHYEGNSELRHALSDACEDGVTFRTVPFCTGSFQGFKSFLSFKKVNLLGDILKVLNPDVVVSIQGTIESCTFALLACRRKSIPVVSYIPYAHKMKTMKAKLGAIRDVLNRYFYFASDGFITISEGHRDVVAGYGINREDIYVVRNFVENSFAWTPRVNGKDAAEKYVCGLIGRVDFRQKGHDFILKTLSKYRKQLSEIVFYMVGSGPDSTRLENMVKRLGLESQVQIIGWQNDLQKLFMRLDCIVVPSRYEGVPLTMVESVAAGVPVIGSSIPGISEYLPQTWQFSLDNPDTFLRALEHMRKDKSAVLSELKMLQIEFSNKFVRSQPQVEFVEALLKVTDRAKTKLSPKKWVSSIE